MHTHIYIYIYIYIYIRTHTYTFNALDGRARDALDGQEAAVPHPVALIRYNLPPLIINPPPNKKQPLGLGGETCLILSI